MSADGGAGRQAEKQPTTKSDASAFKSMQAGRKAAHHQIRCVSVCGCRQAGREGRQARKQPTTKSDASAFADAGRKRDEHPHQIRCVSVCGCRQAGTPPPVNPMRQRLRMQAGRHTTPTKSDASAIADGVAGRQAGGEGCSLLGDGLGMAWGMQPKRVCKHFIRPF